jgi:hypothetical protein
MLYQTADPDPLDTVSSVLAGYHFPCPDLASVDQHIAKLRERLGPASNLTPTRQEAARRDIDRLLERRMYLMLAGGATGRTGQRAA